MKLTITTIIIIITIKTTTTTRITTIITGTTTTTIIIRATTVEEEEEEDGVEGLTLKWVLFSRSSDTSATSSVSPVRSRRGPAGRSSQCVSSHIIDSLCSSFLSATPLQSECVYLPVAVSHPEATVSWLPVVIIT